jgi:hypothetical protein
MAAVDGILGHTTLHKAIDGSQLHVLAWLLDDVRIPAIDTKDLRGSSPLTIACAKVCFALIADDTAKTAACVPRAIWTL